MRKTSSKSLLKNTGVIIIIIIIIIGAILWYFFNSSSTSIDTGFDQEVSLSSSKYDVSLKHLETLIESLETSVFKLRIFETLESFIKLPLERARTGKENPFATPPAPEDLLLIPE